LDCHNGHRVFTRDRFIRPNTGALFGADREKLGVGGQVSRALTVDDTEHGTNNQFVRRK